MIRRWRLTRLVARTVPRRLILGASNTCQTGWISTDVDLLDVTSWRDWERVFGRRRADALMAEHVWEHLNEDQTRAANANCFTFLTPGGYLRLAVPDGFHPDPKYIEYVRPGGTGAGATDHKIQYNYRLLTSRLEMVGFTVSLLEYWDEDGRFHFTDWSSDGGHITRSRRFDERNVPGNLAYTSLIVDATKPLKS